MLEKSNLKREQISKTAKTLGKKINEFEAELHQSKLAADEAIAHLKVTAQLLSPSHQIRRHPYGALALASLSGFLFIRWMGTHPPNQTTKSKFNGRFGNEISLVKTLLLEATVKAVAKKLISAIPFISDEIRDVERGLVKISHNSQPPEQTEAT